MAIKIIEADLSKPSHQKDLIHTLNTYALDPMGGGEGLSDNVKSKLASALHKRKNITVFLAYVDEHASGLLICMEAFSTFVCKPLMNIHDLVVCPEFRGRGISHKLLGAAEKKAATLGCCKLTLEVLEGNNLARAVYKKFGFQGYELDPQMGQALFLEKTL